MRNLSPHRRFTNPGNMDGIPRVRTRRPLPVRDKPLSGTKTMQTPRDGSLDEMIHRTIEPAEASSRTAHVMGWLAVTGVVALWCLLWYIARTPGADLRSHGGLFTALVILLLGGIHVFAIFSQILSNGRNRTGSMALILLYGGSILLAVADHLLR